MEISTGKQTWLVGTPDARKRACPVRGALDGNLLPKRNKALSFDSSMFQGAYTSEAWAAQIRNPQNRVELVRPVIEGQGGKLLSVYYAFGEYDVIAIVEFPDNVSASAVTLALAGGGGFKSQKTTVLMSIEEGLEAMRRASGTGYRPPGS